jgi:hypothetical protein
MTDLEPDIADKLSRIKDIKDQMTALEFELDVLNELFVVPMKGVELIVGSDGTKYRVTKVAGNSPVYDYAVFESLSDYERTLISETKIVGAKLKSATETGRIDIDKVASLVSYKPKKPYAKFDQIP